MKSTGLSRRGILKGAAVAGAAMAGSPAAFAAAPIRFDMAIYDERYADGRAFAAAMRGRGVAVHAMAGDVTRLWYEVLDRRWKDKPVALAGLTDPNALLSLDLMAAAVGMRVSFQGSFRLDAAGRLTRRIDGPAEVVEAAVDLPLEQAWGLQAARLVLSCPAAWETKLSAFGMCEAPPEVLMRDRTNGRDLVAWVLAPVIRS